MVQITGTPEPVPKAAVVGTSERGGDIKPDPATIRPSWGSDGPKVPAPQFATPPPVVGPSGDPHISEIPK
jgi:hypothetical protein